MAEQITHDVVKEAQSVGGPSPIDDPATSPKTSAGDGDAPSAPPTTSPKPSETTSTNAPSTDGAPGAETQASDKAGSDAAAKPAAESSDQQSTRPAVTEAKERLVNGDSGEHSAPEDAPSQHLVGEASGGSDTDISRPGSVDNTKERPAGHLRSNSLKKPASFKSVSVTKNFLAKSAVSTPSALPGTKAAPVGQANTLTQPTAKPRLVAKSGGGLGNVSRSSLSKTNGVGSGPDASKVWNKNQPVAPPPPKQFTDEELKQQFGIHLASRLQADDASKEAKWADIDDDEDDWAPDTVQWMDGTKSTVAPAVENQPPPPEEPKPSVKKEPTEAAKPAPAPVTITPRPSSTTGTKTILKPGAHTQPSTGKAGLVLKGQPEKPSLVAKPLTAAPAKSPWAPLPPVDRVSPVQINPPAQPPPPSRFSQRDHHAYDGMPPPHAPTREMAPDDFNRTWRDERGNRELFNSHSGRYEPVNDTRRGSMRDNTLRQQPSLLQRPSQDGPAEPSAAFQTSRTSGEAPAWGRRRTSSNVSGGSGRMLLDRWLPDHPPMATNVRRDSHTINGIVAEAHPSLTQKPSPSLSHVQPASPFGSVGSAGPQEGPAAPVTPVAAVPIPVEDPVEVQNRLMREKLEHARLMKQKEREREEKEEAERKERLRKKLEAMGLAGDAKPEAKEKSPSRPAEKSPQKEKAVPASVHSPPPKPPVPTSEGEVAQYGMMKVHQPHPVKKQQPAEAAPKPSRGAGVAPKPSSSPVRGQAEVQPSAPSQSETATPSLTAATQDDRKTKPPSGQSQSHAPQSEGNVRSTNQAPASQGLKATQAPPSAWSTTLPPRQSQPWGSAVWGPPQAKDRALGNGTFDSGYNRGQPRASPSQLPPQPPPGQAPVLGLTPPLKPAPAQQQGTQKPPFTQPTMQAQSENKPAQQLTAAPTPGPIAPPASKGWGNFAATIRRDDQAMVAKARQDLERMGGEAFRPEIRETYTDQKGKTQQTVHTKVGGNAAMVNGIKPDLPQAAPVERKPKDEVAKPAYNAAATSEGAAPALSQPSHIATAGTSTRSSRFFPRASDAPAQSAIPSHLSDSPPPPPPETDSHPAFSGHPCKPVVRMPQPTPRVRLPPPATEPVVPAESPVSMPPRGRLGLGARPLALNPEWQARFNSLLDKSAPVAPSAPGVKPSATPSSVSHARPGALAIAASSKAPLEVRQTNSSATVSLPYTPSRRLFADDGSSEVTTRQGVEDMLLEEREFGSLPVVKVPATSHIAAGEPAAGFPRNIRQRPLDTTTRKIFNVVEQDRHSDTIDVIIRLNGMGTAVTKAMAKKREYRKGPGNRGPKRNFTLNGSVSNSNQNQRSRKPSNYQGQNPNANQPTRPSGGNAWNGNRNTPAYSSSTWARRTDPVH